MKPHGKSVANTYWLLHTMVFHISITNRSNSIKSHFRKLFCYKCPKNGAPRNNGSDLSQIIASNLYIIEIMYPSLAPISLLKYFILYRIIAIVQGLFQRCYEIFFLSIKFDEGHISWHIWQLRTFVLINIFPIVLVLRHRLLAVLFWKKTHFIRYVEIKLVYLLCAIWSESFHFKLRD